MAPAALFKTRPLKALDLATSDGLTQWRQLASRLEELWQGRAAVEQVCKEAEKLGVEALLEYLLSVSFRLARTLLTSPPQAEAASLLELRALEQALQPVTATAQGRLTTARRLIRFRQHVEQAVMQIRSAANPNIQLMLESLLRRWQALPRI